MAEGRMIKKEIADSEKMAMCGDRAKVIYFMMLPHADIEGRVKACPVIVKGRYLTMLKYTEKSVQSSLEELHRAGLIILYAVNGDQFAEYTRFSDFQTLKSNREAKTKIPAPTPADSGSTPADSGSTPADSGSTPADSGSTPADSGSTPENSPLSKVKLSISKDKLSKDKLSKDKISISKDKISISKDKIKEDCQNSDEFRLASLLFEEIKKRKPDFKGPNLQTWPSYIDKMIRLDKRSPERIEQVIRWAQADTGNGRWNGWQNNILSTAQLREKFDKLELAMDKSKPKNTERPKVCFVCRKPANNSIRPNVIVCDDCFQLLKDAAPFITFKGVTIRKNKLEVSQLEKMILEQKAKQCTKT